jgi:hypothetical protein
LLLERPKWLKPAGARRIRFDGAIAGCVDIANPPQEGRLHLRVACVIFRLQRLHSLERMRSGEICMNNAVAQTRVRLLLLDQQVSVDDPVHGSIAHGMGSNGDAGLVEKTHHLAVDIGIQMRVAAVALSICVFALRSQSS